MDDPDNSLIGLTPSHDILKNVAWIDVNPKKDNSLSSNPSSSSGNSGSSNNISSTTINGRDLTKDELSELIIHWSQMKDEKLVIEEMKKLAQSLQVLRIKPLKKGDLVILRRSSSSLTSPNIAATNNNNSSSSNSTTATIITYARVMAFDEKKGLVTVYMDPAETESLEVSKYDVYGLTDGI